MLSRRAFLASTSGGLLAAGLPTVSHAQVHDGASRMIVGFPPGGPTDTVARLFAEALRTTYASKIVVDNRPGAAGRLAVDAVKAADPDGHSILFTPSSILTTYPHVYKNLKYNAMTDLAPVAAAGTIGFALSVGPAVPASVKTLADFIAWCKANPAKSQYASPAVGASPHFVGAMIGKAAGIEFQHVPYRGSAPMITDLLGGQIASTSTTIFDTLAQVADGKLRVLATSGPKRSIFLPDVPTFTEQGFPTVQVVDWFGFMLPAKATPDVVTKLAAALKAAAAQPVIQQRLKDFGFESVDWTPAEVATRMKADTEQWGPVVKSTGFTIDD